MIVCFTGNKFVSGNSPMSGQALQRFQLVYRSTCFTVIKFELLVPLFITFLFFSPEVAAIGLDVRSSGRSHLDFTLQFQNASLDLVDGNTAVETDFTRIGVAVFDVPAKSSIHTGLLLGYAFADHPGQQLAQGLEMDGAYLGIAIRTRLVDKDPLGLELHFNYIYQSTSASEESERLSLEWNEFGGAVHGGYRVNSSLRVVAAATFGIIDAKQRFRGAVNQTLKMENDTEAGGMLGLDYLVNQREYIGFHFDSGIYDGINIVFQKLF